MDMLFGTLNNTGLKFVEFALPMLIQSSLLILILLAADYLLRKKVRAVFRYWIWMLVLIKLILPVSLSSPLSLGSWFGEKIEYANLTQEDTGQRTYRSENARHIRPVNHDYTRLERRVEGSESVPSGSQAIVTNPLPTTPDSTITEPIVSPVITEETTEISWQAIVFIIWIAIAAGLSIVLLKRTVFIRELVTKATDIDFDDKSASPSDVLKHCCQHLGLKKQISLKISPDATSPAVCGLFRPVILLPQNLISSMSPGQLKAIFFHELAHIRRGDLWVNLLQTILQITYFYNPLFWFANSIIRRTREQAVDEMVLVAMGKDAREYPETLLNVAKLAFKRPALSLRLIGVVESEDALTGRIKHILNRPIPKTAKLGILGLIIIILAAVILVPMGKKSKSESFVDTTKGYIRCDSDISELGRILVNMAYLYEFKQEFASSTGFGNDKSPVKYSTTNYIIPDNKKLSIEAIAEKNQPLIIQIDLESGALYSLAEITTELARQLGIFPKAAKLINKSEASFSIKLLGVSEHPGEDNQWWKPDGSLLAEQPYGTIKGDRVFVYNNKEKAYEFVVRLDGDNTEIVKWKTEPSDGSYMKSYPETKDNKLQKDLHVLVTRIPSEQDSCTLEINTESWFTLVKVTETQHTYAFGDFTARLIPPKYEDGKYVIKVQETEKEFDNRYKRRYVIKFKDSEKLVNLESLTKQTSYNNEDQLRLLETIYTLDSGYNPDNIEYVAAQFGFEQTFTFKNVSLAAQHKTNVQTSSSGPGIPSFIYADLNKPPVPRLTELSTGVVKGQEVLFFHSVHPQTLWQTLIKDKECNPKWYFCINGIDYPLGISGQLAHSRYEQIEAFSFPHYLKDRDKQWSDGDYSLSVVIKDTVWLDPKEERHYYKELVTNPIEFKIKDGSFLSNTGTPIPREKPLRSKEFKTALLNGGTLELVGVRKKSLPDQPWYSPDGSRKLDSSDEIFSHINSTSGIVNVAGTQTYEFFIHCDLPSNKISKVVKNKWSFEPEKGIPGAFSTSFSSGQHYFTASMALPERLNKTNLSFSVSNGPWKTIAESDGEKEKEVSISHRGQKQNFTLGKIVEKDGSTFIEVKHKIKEMAAQIIVFEKNNIVRYPLDNVIDYADPNGNILITKCKFDGMTKDQIDHYEFQIQPIDIVTFKDISLKNEFYTNPEITTTSITEETKETENNLTHQSKVPWGQAVEGAQIRLVNVKQIWGRSDWSDTVIQLQLEARNNGQRYLSLPENGLTWQIEVDGQWYEWISPQIFNSSRDSNSVGDGKGGVSLDFNAGDSYDDLKVDIAGNWRQIPKGKEIEYAVRRYSGSGWLLIEGEYGSELVLKSGKHTIRTAITCPPSRAGVGFPEIPKPVRLISNPIEFEILPKEKSESNISDTGLNIYLLADENIDLKTAEAQPLSELVLRDKPWIASDDIAMYDASSHCIYLKKERPELPIKNVSLQGTPFVVTVDGQRCYLGSLWTNYSSLLPERNVPLIFVPDFTVPADIVRIQLSPLLSSSDEVKQMQDIRIIQSTKEKGLYHAGLEMVLNKAIISKTDSGSSLSYTYTLTNKDVDDLYVFDPNKMGTGLFHYFNNCPLLFPEGSDHFIKGDNDKIVKSPDPLDKIDKSWFTLLKSGQSMTRTETLGTYPEIVPGKYECSFIFHSPGLQFTKDKRAQFDKRVWMGQIEAKLSINVTGIEPLPSSQISKMEMFERIMNDEEIDLSLIYQSLIGPQTALKAEAAQYLGNHGDSNSIPYLIESLSDESYNVGTHWIDKGMYTTRYWANDSLKKLTGKDFGFVWDDPIEKRNEAIQRWRNWWEQNKDSILVPFEAETFSTQVKKAWQLKANEARDKQTGRLCIFFDIKYNAIPELYYTDPNIIMSYQIKSLTMNDIPIIKKGNGGLVSIWNKTGSGIIRRPEEIDGLAKLKPGTYPVKLELEGDIYEAKKPNNILEHWELEINQEIKLTQLIFMELGISQ